MLFAGICMEHAHHVKQNKTLSERHISHIFTPMRNIDFYFKKVGK
jgi:hypothetical protein